MPQDQAAKPKKYEDDPNPNAKIGFVIFYPFQFYIFKNVYRHLASESEFIIDTGSALPKRQPEEVVKNIVSLLKKHAVRFRVLYAESYSDEDYLKRFFSQYNALISLWWKGCIPLPCNEKKRKVHMYYGAGKELLTFSTIHRLWDLNLCLNRYTQGIMKLFTWSETVGYPKFDDWFNNELDANFIEDVNRKLDPNKKTVLYLPTHSDLCSIDYLAGELKNLTSYYNVLAKLHYYTPREEPERVKKLTHPGILLFFDETDLSPLLKIADVVISDNSSAIFDAVLADKPVAVADFLSKEYLDSGHRKLKGYKLRGPEGALTYSGSIEQRIKKEQLVVVVKTPQRLPDAVEQALRDELLFQNARKKLRQELFAFRDGQCGRRAAEAIKRLLSAEELPEKPILYHVLDAERRAWLESWSEHFTVQKPDFFWQTNEMNQLFATQKYLEILKIKSLPLFQKIRAILKEFF